MQNIQSSSKQPCSRCGYSHPYRSCPAFNCKCYNCHQYCAFHCPHAEDSALVDYQQFLTGTENLEEGPADLAVIEDQASHLVGEGRHTETTPHSSQFIRSSHSPSQDGSRRRFLRCGRHNPTPYRHQASHIMSFDSNNEGQL